MSTKQDIALIYSHLAGPLRGQANGPAVKALHRLQDSLAEQLGTLETIADITDETSVLAFSPHEISRLALAAIVKARG